MMAMISGWEDELTTSPSGRRLVAIERSRYASPRDTSGTKRWRGTIANASAIAGEPRQPFDRSVSTRVARSASGSSVSDDILASRVGVIGLTPKLICVNGAQGNCRPLQRLLDIR